MLHYQTGSRLWIISEEMSINRLTKPSAQMAAGSRGGGWVLVGMT